MAIYSVGTAYLQVVPSFRGIEKELKREAEKLGHRIGEDVEREMRRGVRDGTRGKAKDAEKEAGHLADTIRRRLERALRAVPKVEVDADTSPAQRQLQRLRARLEQLSETDVGVDLDHATALAEIDQIRRELQRLEREDANIQVDVDSAAALAELAAISAAINRLRRDDVGHLSTTIRNQLAAAIRSIPDIDLDADITPAQRQLAEIRADLVALGDEEIGVDIDAATALAQLRHLETELERLSRNSPDIQVRIDSAAAIAELATIRAAVAGLSEPSFARGVGRRTGAEIMAGITAAMVTPNRGILATLRSGIPAALSTPLGAAALVLGVDFIVAFVAAALGSGALLALATGITAAGAIALRQNEALKQDYVELGALVNNIFAQTARAMLAPFRRSADLIGSYFEHRIAPRLESLFTDLAPGIEPLLEGLLGAVESFLAGIQPHMDQFVHEFLIPVSAELPRLGSMVSDFFRILIENGPELVDTFRDLLTFTEELLKALAHLINFFSANLRVLRFLSGAQPDTEAAYPTITDSLLGPFAEPVERWVNRLFGVDDEELKQEQGSQPEHQPGELPPHTYDPVADSAGEAANAVMRLAIQQGHLVSSSDEGKRGLELFEAQANITTQSMGDAIAEAEGLANALDILNGSTLNVRDTERNFQEAIDRATEAIEDNGRTLNVNTEEGRANQANLDRIATTARDAADAVYEHTLATEGEAAAQEAATAKMQEGREALISVAREMGLSREKAEALADQIAAIPERWVADIIVDTSDMKNVDQLSEAIRKLRDKKITITVETINRVLEREFGAGANFVNRYGGVYMAADGMVNLGNRSQLFPGTRTLYGFSEPGTGGEAFIARNAPRQQSLKYLGIAARWHDAMVLPNERMDVLGYGQLRMLADMVGARSQPSGGNTYNFGFRDTTLTPSKLRSLQDREDAIARVGRQS